MPYNLSRILHRDGSKITAHQPSIRDLNFHFVTIQATTQSDGLKNQLNNNLVSS